MLVHNLQSCTWKNINSKMERWVEYGLHVSTGHVVDCDVILILGDVLFFVLACVTCN